MLFIFKIYFTLGVEFGTELELQDWLLSDVLLQHFLKCSVISNLARQGLTTLLSLSHDEKPFVSTYWSPKYQISRRLIV
jgi:hypothetical protein